MPTVTVSMPYRGCPDTVRRAVDAVLNQTHTNLRLVVVNDGDTEQPPWPALADVTDPRLVRFDLAENRGRYFADAVTLAATDSPWWTVHDADDEAEPTWLETMLAAAEDADVVFTAQRVHPLAGSRTITEKVRPYHDSDLLAHHAHMAGLWSTTWLRTVGGPHPGYRIGWDTLLTATAYAAGRVVVVDAPLYHRHRRRGSLTTSPTTGTRSAARRRVTEELRVLWPKVRAAAADGGAAAVGAVIAATVAPELRDAVAREAAALRDRLASCPAVPVPVPEVVVERRAGERYATDLTAHARLWRGWALDRAGAAELDARLAELQPRVVVEAGSGSSTLVLARYAAATGAHVVTLEHEPRFREATLRLLAEHDVAGRVDVRLAPLVETDHGPWYDAALPDGIGLALVDGPPEGAGGRAAALPMLLPHLAEGWEVWLDDATRPGEQQAVTAWAERYGVAVEEICQGKHLYRITPRPVQRSRVDASDVAVTLLTGQRPGQVEATLGALRAHAPGLLESAHVTVLHNGADSDPVTAEVLDRHDDVIDLRHTHRGLAPIGEATSYLAEAAQKSGREYWLQLQDDWRASTACNGWLDDARRVLRERPDVHQVRLRHVGDQVLTWHMVTRRPIAWRPAGGGVALTADAHLTLNPTLSRTSDIGRVWPALGEPDAQRRAHRAGLRVVAQLTPGVFGHADGGDSLRNRVGSPG